MDMEEKNERAISERLDVFKTVVRYLEEVFGSKVMLHEIETNAKQMTITVSFE